MNTIERLNGFHAPAIPAPADLETMLRRAVGSVLGEGAAITVSVFVNIAVASTLSPAVPVTQRPFDANALREVESNILEAAKGQPPTGVKKLAKLAGYGYSSYFRSAVSALIERGLLRRVRCGVMLP